MRNKLFAFLTMATFLLLSWGQGWSVCAKTDSLFRIERSKNKNVVQYSACVLKNNQISDETPVEAHWILAGGKKEELNILESTQAYGVAHKEKLGENKFRIFLAALKDRDILVEKVKGNYKAVVRINGHLSALERVYVNANDQTAGLPVVHYVDLFGRDLQTNQPTKERITPK